VTLSLVYTEGLLVVFAVVCLYALLRKRWLIAGLAAAAASATSPEGLALFACCAWAAGAAILARPALTTRRGSEGSAASAASADDPRPKTAESGWRRWSALTAPLLAPLGWLAYQAYLWRRTGDLTFWYQVEKRFFNGGFHPWTVTGQLVQRAIDQPGVPSYLIPSLGLLVLAAAAVALWYWKPPAIVTIYAAVTMALVLSSGVLGARPRFFVAAFPFVIALARPVRGPAFHALLGVSAGALGLLTLIIVSFLNGHLGFTP
jgi:hypothetical protein